MYVTGGVGFLNSLRVLGPKYRKSEGVIANPWDGNSAAVLTISPKTSKRFSARVPTCPQ